MSWKFIKYSVDSLRKFNFFYFLFHIFWLLFFSVFYFRLLFLYATTIYILYLLNKYRFLILELRTWLDSSNKKLTVGGGAEDVGWVEEKGMN